MAKFVDALLSREESLQKKARTLSQLIETRKKYSEQYVTTRQEKGINSAIALFQMQRNGNKIMDSIRDITDNIEVIETGWLQNKLRAREEQYEQLSNLIFGLVGIITATLIFVIWLLSRDITGRVKAETNLMALNQNLEQQVETRTKDLKRSFEDMEVKVKFRNLELERQNLELSKRIAELEKNV
jgi:C4-dicarboxylate-specific signal transduction histidine kinase